MRAPADDSRVYRMFKRSAHGIACTGEDMRQVDRVTVLLAEDHAVVREGTRQMLERDPRIDVVGEAPDGQAAIELSESLAPDVLLLDISLPLCNGVEVTRAVRALSDAPRVLVLSAYDDAGYVTATLAAGASGYLLKTASGQEVLSAIVAVAADEVVLDHSVAALAFSAAAGGSSGSLLSERETDVLNLAAAGHRTKEIAARLSLSTRTVESHFTSIFNKLGVDSRLEAVMQASERGLLSHDEDR